MFTVSKFFWLPILLVSLGVDVSNAQSFEVEGILKYRTADGVEKNHKKFKMSVSGCSWLIETENADTEIQISSDSKSVFTLMSPKKAGPIPAAKVTPGAAPVADQTQIVPIWLALGSRCYLQSITNGKVRPVWQMPREIIINSNFLVKAEWKFSEKAPFLLESMTFYSDGTFFMPDRRKRTLPKPYSEGYVQAVFSVQNFTNSAEGLVIPHQFTLASYGPLPGGTNASDLKPGGVWIGTVEHARAIDLAESFPLKLKQKTGIHDYRLHAQVTNLNSINYLRTNDWIRETNDPQLQGLAKRVKNVKPIVEKDAPRVPRTKQKTAWLLIVLISFGAIALLAVYKMSVKK